MPKVKVRFYAWLKEQFGMNEIEIEARALKELINKIATQIKGARSVDMGSIIIAKNNKIIDMKQNVELEEGDIIDIMPIGSGG